MDSPWFDKIELELSSGKRPDNRQTDLYHQYEEMYTLCDILNGSQRQGYGQNDFATYTDPDLKARERRSWRLSSKLPHGTAASANFQTWVVLTVAIAESRYRMKEY